ncbi:MAG TPA: D-2-hydroxyacid dehydrogenase family protein [Acetobacteraceae bacterium]|nr:D-2-hydroxyacid dehydrogenase family protein [Acetobacteraceae bacterium]
MKIAVLDDYQDAFRHLRCYPRLAGHEVVVFHDTIKDPDALAARLAGFEAVLLTQQRTDLPASVINRLPGLRLICQTGRNTHVDLAAATARGIPVVAGSGGSVFATVELTWALILAAQRNIPAEVARLHGGQWQGSVGVGLHGRVLGIYAPGRIGARVAAIGAAFGMRVLCWGREASRDAAGKAGFAMAESRTAFFAQADVLSLHLPLNEATRGIVTAADLAGMKPGALLVNTSRAAIIAEGALAAALRAGRPGRAAVDVYEEEPVLNAAHPLLALPNALCTPHLGYVEADSYEALFGSAIDQILAFAEGRDVARLNPPPGNQPSPAALT